MARIGGGVGTSRGFLQSVNRWTKATKERSEEAFKIGVLDFAIALNEAAPIDTGFLRSSLTAGVNGSIPQGPNAEYGSVYNDQRLLSVIEQLKLGDRITLVYQAPYAARVNSGFTGYDRLGRYYNQSGYFWIEKTGARWRSILRSAATRLRGSTAM